MFIWSKFGIETHIPIFVVVLELNKLFEMILISLNIFIELTSFIHL